MSAASSQPRASLRRRGQSSSPSGAPPAWNAAPACLPSSGSPIGLSSSPLSSTGWSSLILADARAPVSFFAYPGKESSLLPDGCEVHELSPPTYDVLGSLEELVEALDAADAEARAATAVHAATA